MRHSLSNRTSALFMAGILTFPSLSVTAQEGPSQQAPAKSAAPKPAAAAPSTTLQNAATVDKAQLVVGQIYYISTDSLNVRTSTQTASSKNIAGKLAVGDRVELVDVLTPATPLVQVKIVRSSSFKPVAGQDYFISKDFLSAKEILGAAGKYFIVQNIATEMTRVYERCTETPDCPHKLILETEMVVGRAEEGTETNPHAFKTWLGHAKISEWIKFYQDNAGHYPHWYKQGQNLSSIPEKAPRNTSTGKPESSFFWGRKWMTKDENKKDTIYGAFGWYAAKIHPSDEYNGLNYQWIHGTIGWASDKQAPIELTRSFLLNLVSNPGSAGCTRLSNGQVAYLRHLLMPGTDIYRVYAREATRENTCAKKTWWGTCKQENVFSRYRGQPKEKPWEYIMLTNGAQRSGGLTADAEFIRRNKVAIIPGQNLIETGTIEIDQYPNAMPGNYTRTAASGKSGDRYRIDDEFGKEPTKFKGVYLVDEGRFIDYQHPSPTETQGKIRISGLAEFRKQVPAHLATAGSYFMEEIVYQKDNNSYQNAEDSVRLNIIDDRVQMLPAELK